MKKLIILVVLAVCFTSCKYSYKDDVVNVSPSQLEEIQNAIFVCEKAGMSYTLLTSIFSKEGTYVVYCRGKLKGKEKEKEKIKTLGCMDAYRLYEREWRRDIAEK
jgi:hypothetical protein